MDKRTKIFSKYKFVLSKKPNSTYNIVSLSVYNRNTNKCRFSLNIYNVKSSQSDEWIFSLEEEKNNIKNKGFLCILGIIIENESSLLPEVFKYKIHKSLDVVYNLIFEIFMEFISGNCSEGLSYFIKNIDRDVIRKFLN